MTSNLNSSPIVKCSHCKQIISAKSFDTHKCELHLTGQKVIQVIDYLDISNNEKKQITAQGIDGVLYIFEVVPRKATPIILPDDFSQTKNNRRRLPRTKKKRR